MIHAIASCRYSLNTAKNKLSRISEFYRSYGKTKNNHHLIIIGDKLKTISEAIDTISRNTQEIENLFNRKSQPSNRPQELK